MYKNLYPPPFRIWKSLSFECSECSEMKFALTTTLGGCNQWIRGLAQSGSQHFNCHAVLVKLTMITFKILLFLKLQYIIHTMTYDACNMHANLLQCCQLSPTEHWHLCHSLLLSLPTLLPFQHSHWQWALRSQMILEHLWGKVWGKFIKFPVRHALIIYCDRRTTSIWCHQRYHSSMPEEVRQVCAFAVKIC